MEVSQAATSAIFPRLAMDASVCMLFMSCSWNSVPWKSVLNGNSHATGIGSGCRGMATASGISSDDPAEQARPLHSLRRTLSSQAKSCRCMHIQHHNMIALTEALPAVLPSLPLASSALMNVLAIFQVSRVHLSSCRLPLGLLEAASKRRKIQ